MAQDILSILVVEDNPGDARLIQEMLKEAGNRRWEMAVSGSLSTALDHLSHYRPDLIFLDLGLPDSQGLKTLDRLFSASAGTPVIIMTGLDDEITGLAAVRSGAQDYLLKGDINARMLWRVVNYALERHKTEIQLRESEQRYRSLIEIIPMGITIVQEGKIIYSNRQTELITGYSGQELKSIDGFNLIHPEERDNIRRYFTARMSSGQAPAGYILRIIHKNGSVRWLERHVALINWNNEPAVLVIDNDITQRKQAELTLQKAEANLKQAQALGRIGSWETDLKTLNTFWSEEMYELFEREKTLGPPVQDELMSYYLPSEAKKWQEMVQHVVDSGQETQDELNTRLPSGRKLITRVLIKPLRDETGKVTGLFGTLQDITEQKLVEQELKQKEEFLDSVIENTPNPLWISDACGNVIRMNQALRDLLKVKDQDVIGSYNVLKDIQIKEQGFMKMVESVYREGKTVNFPLYYYTKREEQIKSENKVFLVLDITIAALKDKEGRVVNAICLHRDITGQEKARLALKKSEENFRNSLDSSPLGVRIVDKNEVLLYTNRAMLDIYGYQNVDELVNTPPSARYTPESYAELQERRKKRAANQFVPETFEVKIIRRDGQVRTLQVIRKEVIWNGEQHFQSVYLDITERKQAEARLLEIEALKQSNKAKSDLLANVSHELRTPLAAIKGFIETLLEADVNWSRDQQRDFLKSADKEVDRLTFLIRDLLDMSRLDSGKMVLDKRPYQVQEILDYASSTLSVMTSKHKLEIKVPHGLPPLNVDRIRIAQVITNLVENAVKFSNEGSSIIIEVKSDDGNLVFSVEDQGEGISPEHIEKLFDRFYQAGRATSGKTRGTGLGLAICKGIIEAHGGKIWVESQTGVGSVFSFKLPVK